MARLTGKPGRLVDQRILHVLVLTLPRSCSFQAQNVDRNAFIEFLKKDFLAIVKSKRVSISASEPSRIQREALATLAQSSKSMCAMQGSTSRLRPYQALFAARE